MDLLFLLRRIIRSDVVVVGFFLLCNLLEIRMKEMMFFLCNFIWFDKIVERRREKVREG